MRWIGEELGFETVATTLVCAPGYSAEAGVPAEIVMATVVPVVPAPVPEPPAPQKAYAVEPAERYEDRRRDDDPSRAAAGHCSSSTTPS